MENRKRKTPTRRSWVWLAAMGVVTLLGTDCLVNRALGQVPVTTRLASMVAGSVLPAARTPAIAPPPPRVVIPPPVPTPFTKYRPPCGA